jgi:hypothetical protein
MEGLGSKRPRPASLLGNTRTCPSLRVQESFKDRVAASSNFTYVAARPAAPTFTTQKWAWTGEVPGAWVELLIDSREDPSADDPPPPDRTMTVILGYVKSYESMGNAKVCIRRVGG